VAEEDGRVTVYLERANKSSDPAMGLTTTIDEVEAILNASQESSGITATLSGNPAYPPYPLAAPTGGFLSLSPSDPYTLAKATLEIQGEHNDIVFSVANAPGAAVGEAGNALSVRYAYSAHPTESNPTTVEMSGTTLVVTLANSGALFLEEYARAYNDPGSPGFRNAKESERIARGYSTLTTAAEVVELVARLDPQDNPYGLTASLADGNSGLGRVGQACEQGLSGGYDQAALFRVSQDGGKTWGEPMSVAASEFQNGLFYNNLLGHASLTTDIPGDANDIVLTANYMGTWGDDLRLEYLQPKAANQAFSVSVGPSPWNIQVNLATDSQGRVTTTANDIVAAINRHPEASQLVTASLADYHVGGDGIVRGMDCVALSTGEPYEVAGTTRITPLGHATATVSFPYDASASKSPDLIYQAMESGTDGNYIGVRYTMSADTSVYPDAEYQDHVTISYEERPNGDKVDKIMVVHLATASLPSCPDIDSEREAYDAFRALYPVYSCSSSRTVTSTAGDVLEALVAKNLQDPGNAVVWASMEYKDEGWDSTAKVGPTDGTVWLSGGDDGLREEDYGVALRFIADGSPIGVGDRFEVGVGWYNGDGEKLEVHVSEGTKVTMNVTGDALLGANGEEENVLDTLKRLEWALLHNDVEGVERELPHLRTAIQRLTTEETKVGTSLIRNQYLTSNLELNKYAAENTLSQVEDADFTTLITNLKNAQLVYEAVLGTTGLTTKLSLLDYI
jgi:flagellin-like hook-associated protein FlgL